MNDRRYVCYLLYNVRRDLGFGENSKVLRK